MTQLIQPKQYLPKFDTRRKAIGKERRGNIRKYILEKASYFPKPIEYSDIDQAMYDWVDKTFNLAYNGKRLPTYKLFSTQRLSEYSSTWSNVDDSGSVILNFKSLTRETNPQKGESQGSTMNIPGHRCYTMYLVPVLQESGDEAFDLYTMKEPYAVNFTYSVSIITNKYELLNEMNSQMHYQFQAINDYINVNGHYMPLTLDDISDESEYDLEERKYYSQTFKIKLKAYIIRKEDYTVKRVPSKLVMYTNENVYSRKGSVRQGRQAPREYDIQTLRRFMTDSEIFDELEKNGVCNVHPTNKFPDANYNVEVVEEQCPEECPIEEDDQKYYNKILKVIMRYNECESSMTFNIDTDMVIEKVETENVYDFKLLVNGEVQDIENHSVKIYNEDEIIVKITRDDDYSESSVILVGYDPNDVYDKAYNPESSLDETPNETEIIIKTNIENDKEN